jgi:glycosyltransferase involved in cell wall biosynthesis
LAVVRFPIDHPACFFHQFPWSDNHTSGYIFWAFFHFYAPVQLFFIGCKYKVNRIFTFGYNYSLLMQPLRLAKKIPLTVFLRGDTIENHRISGRSCLLIRLEYFLEGLGIAGSRMYGVSESLTNKTIAQHRLLRPLTIGVLRNDIVRPSAISKNKRKVDLPLRLACVGMLAPNKNQRFLVEVMKGINAKQAQLYLYGVGPDEDFLKKAVEKGNMTDRIHFMGWVSAENIWPEIDLLLMPSLHEGAPNSVLEALGHAVPVLASDIPEHAEILPHMDLLLVRQPQEWIKFLYQERTAIVEKLIEMVKRQSACCEKFNFNWENEFIKLVIQR